MTVPFSCVCTPECTTASGCMCGWGGSEGILLPWRRCVCTSAAGWQHTPQRTVALRPVIGAQAHSLLSGPSHYHNDLTPSPERCRKHTICRPQGLVICGERRSSGGATTPEQQARRAGWQQNTLTQRCVLHDGRTDSDPAQHLFMKHRK